MSRRREAQRPQNVIGPTKKRPRRATEPFFVRDS